MSRLLHLFSASGFNPTSLPGLQFLFDHLSERRANADGSGALVTTDGTSFKWWQDRSGNGNHVSRASGTAPTLKLNGTDRRTSFVPSQALSAAWSPGTITDFSLHALVRRTSDSTGLLATFLGTGGTSYFGFPWTTDVVNAFGSSTGSSWGGKHNYAMYLCWVREGTSLRLYVNGNHVHTLTNSTTFTPDIIQLGRYSTTSYTSIDVASIALAASAHTQGHISGYYNWLRSEFPSEFGLSSNLLLYACNSLGTGLYSGVGSGLMPKVHAGGFAPSFTNWINGSVGGKTTTQMRADYLTRLVPMISATTGKIVVFLWEGSNDMVLNAMTGAQAAANMFAHVQEWQAVSPNVRVVVAPVIDRGDFPTGWSTKKADYNGAIRDSGNISAYGYTLADTATVAEVTDDGANANATYYANNAHLNGAGNDLVKSIIGAAVEAALAA